MHHHQTANASERLSMIFGHRRKPSVQQEIGSGAPRKVVRNRNRQRQLTSRTRSIAWSGQFEYLDRAQAKLKVVVPFTLLIVFVLSYFVFRRFDEAALIMATLRFAVIGGFWFLYLLGHDVSIATAVGVIALGGRSG